MSILLLLYLALNTKPLKIIFLVSSTKKDLSRENAVAKMKGASGHLFIQYTPTGISASQIPFTFACSLKVNQTTSTD